MQQNTPVKPSEATGRLENLASDMARQPKRLMTAVLIVCALVAGVVILVRMNSNSVVSEVERINQALMDAMGKQDAAERANAFSDLLVEVKGTAQEPYVLLNTARAERDAADAAENPSDKEKLFERAIAHVGDFNARYSDNLLARLPWRPALQPGQTVQSVSARLSEYCSAQLAWLKAHPSSVTETTDAGFTATMALIDPDGKKHSFELRFFSADAPHAVANFTELARNGYLNGSLVYAQERETLESTAGRGMFFGSAQAKVSPDKPALWGGANEDVGFTLPKESNRLKPKRGRLLMEKYFDAGAFVGMSPVGFLLATADIPRTDERVVFAEVVGTPEVLTLLEGALVKKDPQEHVDNCAVHILEKPWTIESVSISGEPTHKPEVAVLRSFQLPKPPEIAPPGK